MQCNTHLRTEIGEFAPWRPYYPLALPTQFSGLNQLEMRLVLQPDCFYRSPRLRNSF